MIPKLRVAAGAGAALAVLAVAIVLATAWGRRSAAAVSTSTSGLTATLSVEAFDVGDPPPRSWTSAAFAESLVARLALMPGLTVRVGGASFGSATEFTVRGDVTARDGRLVIAARLYLNTQRDAVWTATFWRADSLTSDLVGDLAGGVAEAIYGQLARTAVTAGGDSR